MRHCIITPDILGPIKNGGIGTHCYFLACLLSRLGHEVTVLLTVPVSAKEKTHWQEHYATLGVNLCYLQDYADISYPVPLGPDLKISLKVWEVLQAQSFDQLHFQDWRAHGFHCIQGRRTTGAFRDSLIMVTAHSSTEWINRGMARWNQQHTEGSKLMWGERYCVEHCDILVSPSYYMVQWLGEAGWILPQAVRVIPNPFVPQTQEAPYAADVSSIAFFGRLETRKGLELFCQALRALPEACKKNIKNLLFVGTYGMCGLVSAQEYLSELQEEFPGVVEMHTNLDSFAAQALLRRRQSLVCIPSLMDNLTYTGIECAVQGMPVIAARTGGIPEVLPAEQLFDPTPAGLASKLESIMAEGSFRAGNSLYCQEKTEILWQELASEKTVQADTPVEESPLISVCVSHYNHGKYLSCALDALAAQDCSYFEVLVTDDGSTDEASREVFAACRERGDSRFRFYEKANEGPCLTRNFCAAQAKGDYLVFVDADNIALPHMLSTMVSAMKWSGAHALSCHFWTFPEMEERPKNILNRWTPLGADLATGITENVFGDVNFIVRRDVFATLGGFAATRHGCEDWEFLARLALAGYIMDVIPLPLFWYRYTDGGMRSTMSFYHSHQLVFSAYKKYLPHFASAAFEHQLVPMSCGHSVSNAVIIRTMLRFGVALEERYTRLFPAGSNGQRFLSWIWHKTFKKCFNKGKK